MLNRKRMRICQLVAASITSMFGLITSTWTWFKLPSILFSIFCVGSPIKYWTNSWIAFISPCATFSCNILKAVSAIGSKRSMISCSSIRLFLPAPSLFPPIGLYGCPVLLLIFNGLAAFVGAVKLISVWLFSSVIYVILLIFRDIHLLHIVGMSFLVHCFPFKYSQFYPAFLVLALCYIFWKIRLINVKIYWTVFSSFFYVESFPFHVKNKYNTFEGKEYNSHNLLINNTL